MNLIDIITASDITLLGFLLFGLIYLYGWFIVEPEVKYYERNEILIQGLFFIMIFLMVPSLIIGSFYRNISLFNFPLISDIYPFIVTFFFIVLIAVIIYLIYKIRNLKNPINPEKELPSEITILIFSFIGPTTFFLTINTFDFFLISSALILLFFNTLILANTFGYLKRDIVYVSIETDDSSEYHGKLVNEDKYTYSLITVEGLLQINRDKVKTLKHIYGESNKESDVLQEAVGYRGEFNIITGRTTTKEDVAQNIEELETSMRNWLENEVFDEYRDKDIDIAIVYHYSKPDHAKDLDELLKPIISTLDKKENGEEPYLVEDDSQIKQILLKSTKTKKGGSGTEPYKDGHGYITISFREHSPKPMKLISPRVV